MSDESELKERLAGIARDGYRVADRAEVWPLALRMMEHLGSTDPELRDELIWRTLADWAGRYLDQEQLAALLYIVLDAEHLTLGLGEREGDAVFMRAFSSLAVAALVYRHRERPYLSPGRVHEVHRAMVGCLAAERDERGWVPGKGWADAVSHAADALDELVQCMELGASELLETLAVIRDTVVRAQTVFPGEEDERLVTAVVNAVRRGELAHESLAAWIRSFADLERLDSYRAWFWRQTNTKRFLRSLYFRARYEGLAGWFEPALEDTLRRISETTFREQRLPAEAGA